MALFTQSTSPRAFRGSVVAVSVNQFTIDFASIANGAKGTSAQAVADAALGDICLASCALDLQGLSLTAYVNAAGSVTFDLVNNTGGAIDMASTTFTVMILRPKTA